MFKCQAYLDTYVAFTSSTVSLLIFALMAVCQLGHWHYGLVVLRLSVVTNGLGDIYLKPYLLAWLAEPLKATSNILHCK